MIPRIVVYLIQRVIVLACRIKTAEKGRAVRCECLVVAFGDEIISVVRIRIALTVVTINPSHRASGIEKTLAAGCIRSHLPQVVRRREIITVQPLRLHVSAISVNPDLRHV